MGGITDGVDVRRWARGRASFSLASTVKKSFLIVFKIDSAFNFN